MVNYIDEWFKIEFESTMNSPKVWDVFHYLVKWADSYSSFGLHSLSISKDFVSYELTFSNFYNNIKWIGVLVRKPKHRMEYEEKKIQEFKDMVAKRFKRFKPKFLPFDPTNPNKEGDTDG